MTESPDIIPVPTRRSVRKLRATYEPAPPRQPVFIINWAAVATAIFAAAFALVIGIAIGASLVLDVVEAQSSSNVGTQP